MTTFGQARISNRTQIVVFEGPIDGDRKTALVRRTHKSVPIGDPIKRNIRKFNVRIHGENVIRKDWLKN